MARSFVYNAVKHKLLPGVELNPKLFKDRGPLDLGGENPSLKGRPENDLEPEIRAGLRFSQAPHMGVHGFRGTLWGSLQSRICV